MISRLVTGNCLSVMPTLGLSAFDAIVCDPPYHLTTAKAGATGFMGKSWDGGDVAFRPETWAHALRVVKPGSYLLAFGGTRTYHRLTCAIEDAGWEIRDCLCWLYGSGFPKHESKLKPAWEPIVMARRPAKIATPLNIDACRIPVEDAQYALNHSGDRGHAGTRAHGKVTDMRMGGGSANDGGRWPANVVIDEDAAALIDAQSGTLMSGANPTRRGSSKFRNTYGEFEGQEECIPARGVDVGGASRFYYCAKASRTERDAGLDGFESRPLHWSSGDANPGSFQSEGTDKTARNSHPTVKPIAVMRWLCRLITPAGGAILDPFAGSFSTGCATELEGFDFTGIELEERFTDIGRARMAHWANVARGVA